MLTYKAKDTVFIDQTGKFPYEASCGNEYQMVIQTIDGIFHGSWNL